MSGLITTSGSLDFGPLSNRDNIMLARTMRLAAKSHMAHKHAAILYKSGRVLSFGVNSGRNSHPTMEINRKDYTYHAEINAIRLVDKPTLQGATLYVARINKTGEPLLSLPCRNCIIELRSAGIKRVVYT